MKYKRAHKGLAPVGACTSMQLPLARWLTYSVFQTRILVYTVKQVTGLVFFLFWYKMNTHGMSIVAGYFMTVVQAKTWYRNTFNLKPHEQMEDDQHISLLFLIIGNQTPRHIIHRVIWVSKHLRPRHHNKYTNTKLTSVTWLMWNKQDLKFLQEDNHEQTPTELPEAQTSRVGTGFIKMCQRARQ